MRTSFLLLSVIFLAAFTFFSYTVAKEYWQKWDFDSMVKIQDRIPEQYDQFFSYFSLLGSVEVTFIICVIFGSWAFVRGKWLSVIGWAAGVPATIAEIFGKLVLFHPGPPYLLHRSTLPTSLPSFYIHTNYSYPSGHMTRSIFIITVLLMLVIFSGRGLLLKTILISTLLGLAALMGLTRVSLGEHWISDVLGGSLLGIGMGFFSVGLLLRPKKV